MNLYLIGMMGSGKTQIARLVGARLGLPVIDTDEDVVAHFGASVPELWERFGEETFRNLETDALVRAAIGPARVVATGGGVVLRSENVDTMRGSGVVVWLEASPHVLAARVADAAGGRPLLDGGVADLEGRLGTILTARKPLYDAACHHRVSTEGRTPEDVAREVAGWWDDESGRWARG